MKTFISLLAFLLLFNSLWAQTPEEVVSNYFKKIQSGGMNEIAPLMHPDELTKFKQMMLPVVERGLVSEKQGHLFVSFADAKDPKKVKDFSDLDFFREFMAWLEKVRPGVNDALKGAKVEVIGNVPEGDVRHVVVRTKFNNAGVEITKTAVLSVKDYKGKPMMLLTGEIQGLAQALSNKK